MFILPLLSGLLLRFTHPPLSLAWLSWFVLAPFFISLLFAKNYKKVFLYSGLFGLTYFGLLILPFSALFDFVPAPIMSLAMLAFAVAQTVFVVMFGVLLRFFYERFQVFNFMARIYMSLTAPSLWVIFEWLRSLGTFGNTVGVLAYAHYLNVPFLQLTRLGGSYLLSLCVVFVNIVLTLLFLDVVSRRRDLLWNWLGYLLTIIAGGIVVGMVCQMLLVMPGAPRGQRLVSVFQPAIPQQEKLDDTASARIKRMLIEQVRLYSQERKTELIVMPETLVPEFLLHDKEFMFSLRDAVDATVIFGTPRFKNRSVNNEYCNSVVLMNKYGDVTVLHDKKFLVPFGEYVPYRSLLYWLIAPTGFLETEYAKGEDNFAVAGYATAICFESTLPYQLREQVNSGGKMIIVITNDAWYKQTEMLEMHLAFAALRAAENNRYLIQAANTGISAIIDNHGRILGRSAIDERQWLESAIVLEAMPTPYTLLGETTVYVSWIVVVIMGYMVLVALVRKPE